MTELDRRAELSDFLRSRRARLTPDQVGLGSSGRRRTRGLRREEVALLADTSTTWYTWLEQKRDIRVSAPLLERLAVALQLSPDERRHLFTLAGLPLPLTASAPHECVPAAVLRFLAGHAGAPAVVVGRRWDYLAWNTAADQVLGISAQPPEDRNVMRRLFLQPERRGFHTDWACVAKQMVARFRADSAPFLEDPWFASLLQELQSGSPEFRRWWSRHDVQDRPDGRKDLQHPQVGRLVFEHLIVQLPDAPGLWLVLYTPLNEQGTPAKLKRLLAGPVQADLTPKTAPAPEPVGAFARPDAARAALDSGA